MKFSKKEAAIEMRIFDAEAKKEWREKMERDEKVLDYDRNRTINDLVKSRIIPGKKSEDETEKDI